MNKISICIISLMIILSACKDEELSLKRTPYTGNELRIDGFYYRQELNSTFVKYLYRNGIILTSYVLSTTDLNIVETEMMKLYDQLKNDKSRWGVFLITGNRIEYESWSTSVGGGLPTGKGLGTILNDSTFQITQSINSDGTQFPHDEIYHFRQFSPKPDSTNNFIK